MWKVSEWNCCSMKNGAVRSIKATKHCISTGWFVWHDIFTVLCSLLRLWCPIIVLIERVPFRVQFSRENLEKPVFPTGTCFLLNFRQYYYSNKWLLITFSYLHELLAKINQTIINLNFLLPSFLVSCTRRTKQSLHS